MDLNGKNTSPDDLHFFDIGNFAMHMSTKKISVMIFGVAILSGCQTAPTSTPFFHKLGTTIYDKQSVIDSCKIQSLKEIPQAIGTSVTPGMSSPGTTYCNSYGMYGGIQCNTYGGYNIPPQVNNYDMNNGLRDRFVNACMEKKGYTITMMPFCKAGEVGYLNTEPAPPLSKIQCLDRASPLIQ